MVLDLRSNSKTYKQYFSIELSESNGYSLYIPRGLAHGFKSLADNTIVTYFVSTVYNPEYDSGIRWNSFGMDWQIENPIISERDKSFIGLDEFESMW